MSNKNDRWSALSLKDRADLINAYVSNGIKDLKEIKRHYNSFSGEENTPERFIPKEEYLDKQRQAIIDKSIETSNARTLPAVPYVAKYTNEEEWRKEMLTRLATMQSEIEDLERNPTFSLDNENSLSYWKDLKKSTEEEFNKVFTNPLRVGASCIYTATDNYGKKYRVSGNKSFRSNPEKYGFTEIGLNEIKPGDIIQDFTQEINEPHHAVTFMGYDDKNRAIFNYSEGGEDKESIVKGGHYPFQWDDTTKVHLDGVNNDKLRHSAAAYRFIGNKEDNDKWNSEYLKYRQNYENNWLDMAKQVSWNEAPKVLVDNPYSKTILSGEEDTNNNQRKLEAVMRSTNGITGQMFSKEPPFISIPTIISGTRAYYKMKQDNPDMPSTTNDYTGAAVVGGAFKTDGELGFATTDELVAKLGEKPTDFVDSYVYGSIPFKKQGVIEKTFTPEKHIYRTKLASMNREVPVYQTHKDTLNTRLVKDLNTKLSKGQVDLVEENFTHKDSPFQIGDTGIYYDGNNGFVARVILKDGTVAEKALDIFDFTPSEWNYKVGKKAKEGLEFIDKNGHPYLMTSPWYYRKDTRTEEQRLNSMGITLNENGEVVRNVGDASGKVWDLYEALDYISSHPYETCLKNGKIL